MKRHLIAVIAAALAPISGAAAQQAPLPVIGFLNPESPQGYARPLSAFLEGLKEAGYVDGRNVAIEYRWAQSRLDRLPALAGELIDRRVTVIAATTTPAALAAKAATATIPIVFETGGDPVQLGLVASFSRPGGNATGAVQLATELTQKCLQLLHELVPDARAMALLINPSDRGLAEAQSSEAVAGARALQLELQVVRASSEGELDAAFAELVRRRPGGLIIGADSFFTSHAERLAELSVRYAIPALYARREFAAAGGLVSYGSDITYSYHLAGIYTGRVLKGESPATLPVQQATKIDFYLNLKTAKALGITIPLSLMGRVDEVIE